MYAWLIYSEITFNLLGAYYIFIPDSCVIWLLWILGVDFWLWLVNKSWLTLWFHLSRVLDDKLSLATGPEMSSHVMCEKGDTHSDIQTFQLHNDHPSAPPPRERSSCWESVRAGRRLRREQRAVRKGMWHCEYDEQIVTREEKYVGERSISQHRHQWSKLMTWWPNTSLTISLDYFSIPP